MGSKGQPTLPTELQRKVPELPYCGYNLWLLSSPPGDRPMTPTKLLDRPTVVDPGAERRGPPCNDTDIGCRRSRVDCTAVLRACDLDSAGHGWRCGTRVDHREPVRLQCLERDTRWFRERPRRRGLAPGPRDYSIGVGVRHRDARRLVQAEACKARSDARGSSTIAWDCWSIVCIVAALTAAAIAISGTFGPIDLGIDPQRRQWAFAEASGIVLLP